MDQGEQAAEVASHTTAGTEQVAGEPQPIESVSASARHTRISAAWTAVAVAALLGVALIVFIVQNTQKVQIKFFGASGHIPLVVAVLARDDNRSLDRPRGGDLPHHSTPAIRSAAHEGYEGYEASFKSLVIGAPRSRLETFRPRRSVSELTSQGITPSSNMVNEKGNVMVILLLALLVLILFGAGFAVHLLWIAAVVFAVVWVAAFALGRGERRSIRR